MTRTPRIALAALMLVVGLFAGYFIGYYNISEWPPKPRAGPPRLLEELEKTEGNRLRPETLAETAANLDEVLLAPERRGRFRVVLATVERLDAPGIQTAMAALERVPMSLDRVLAAHLLMQRYAELDPRGALHFVEQLPTWRRGFGSASAFGAWAATDPEAAAAHFVQNRSSAGAGWGGPQAVNGAAVAIATEWARANPEAAMDWALELPPETANQALHAIYREWTAADPATAVKRAAELELAPEQRSAVFEQIAGQWSQTDPQAAVLWAMNLPAEEASQALVRSVGGWAQRAPAEAAAYLDAEPSAAFSETVAAVAGSWAEEAPPEAAAWLATQTDESAKSPAVQRVIDSWARLDPEAASAWLTEQPAGPSRDEGIVGLSNAVLGSDPEAATLWASVIEDNMARALQVKRAAREWLRSEPEAAAEWLRGGAVPAEWTAELLANGQ